MRWRPGHLALLVFQAFWLNVLVPAHTRGMVTLGCAACEGADAKARACCQTPAGAGQRGESQHPPTPRDRANCAICHFAAGLTVAPPVDFAPPKLGLLALLTSPAPWRVAGAGLPLPYDGRAPPAAV